MLVLEKVSHVKALKGIANISKLEKVTNQNEASIYRIVTFLF